MAVPEIKRQLLIQPRPAEFKSTTLITADLIDSNRHVNNARYLDIYENHRALYVEALGMGLTHLEQIGIRAFVVDGQVHYRKPVKEGERVEVRTVAQSHRRFLVFNQDMYRGEELVSFFDSRVWIVNQDGRPTRLPQELNDMIAQARFL